MPTYKPRLTRAEQARHLAVAAELLAQGVDIDIPDEWRDHARLRIMIAGPPASSIYQLATGLVVYVARVNLQAEHGVILQDFQVTPPWDGDVIPYGTHEGTPYRFGSGLKYEWNEVLNHRIENYLHFKRGDMREGWLLATGDKPVPEEFGPGKPVHLEVAFLDQFLLQHSACAEFSVQRSDKKLEVAILPRLGLFEPRNTPVTGEGLSALNSGHTYPSRPHLFDPDEMVPEGGEQHLEEGY